MQPNYMERKCSYQAIQKYNSEINKYLKKNGIVDFSKYRAYIKDDQLFFSKWEYSVAKPHNITIQNIPSIYQETHQRILYIDISISSIPQHSTINARGVFGSDNVNKEQIIGIFGLDIEIKNFGYIYESTSNQLLASKFRLHSGLLRTNSELKMSDITKTNFTGRIRILIFYTNS